MTRRAPVFAMQGYYGTGNFGDDWLLASCIAGIAKARPDARFIVRDHGDQCGILGKRADPGRGPHSPLLAPGALRGRCMAPVPRGRLARVRRRHPVPCRPRDRIDRPERASCDAGTSTRRARGDPRLRHQGDGRGAGPRPPRLDPALLERRRRTLAKKPCSRPTSRSRRRSPFQREGAMHWRSPSIPPLGTPPSQRPSPRRPLGATSCS